MLEEVFCCLVVELDQISVDSHDLVRDWQLLADVLPMLLECVILIQPDRELVWDRAMIVSEGKEECEKISGSLRPARLGGVELCEVDITCNVVGHVGRECACENAHADKLKDQHDQSRAVFEDRHVVWRVEKKDCCF